MLPGRFKTCRSRHRLTPSIESLITGDSSDWLNLRKAAANSRIVMVKVCEPDEPTILREATDAVAAKVKRWTRFRSASHHPTARRHLAQWPNGPKEYSPGLRPAPMPREPKPSRSAPCHGRERLRSWTLLIRGLPRCVLYDPFALDSVSLFSAFYKG
jgi:hypothetical protein